MSRITDQQLNSLRALPIEGVAQRLGLQVSRHTSLCPFHDDRHPSLHFNVSRNTYKCFVCDAHGGPIDLVMNFLHLSFHEACQWLADGTNIILTEWKPAKKSVPELVAEPVEAFQADKYLRYFDRPFISQLAGEFLFEKRHLDPRVIRWCRLTSWREWLQIPYFDMEGVLTGVQWRYLGADKSQPRFRFPRGSKCHIYNLPVVKMLTPGEPLYITEGCSDCWAMLSSCRKAIAIPSATTLHGNELLKVLKLLAPLSTPLHIYPDADIPGERLYLQLTAIATEAGLCLYRHSLPVGCKDYSDYYVNC